jgi:uncharacterized lipoprotein YehR (DUF1307 family)
MKKIALILGLLVVVSLTGCTESTKRSIKDTQSEWTGGLNRQVTVYANDGTVIKTYEGKLDIEDTEAGNKIKFDLNGKRVILYNATVIVEEK